VTGKIVLENLKHRPLRGFISALLIGVSVMLILTLVGLSYGMSEDSQRRQAGIGADLIIRGSDAATILTVSSATIPETVIGKLEQQPHIKSAMGVVNHSIDFPLVATGVDLVQLKAFNGGFTYLEGGPFQGPDDVLVDARYAAQNHVKVGDSVKLMARPWRVAGIIGEGKMARVAVPLATLQDINSADHKVTQVYVRLDDPANTDAVIQQLKKLLPNYHIDSMDDLIAMFGVTRIPGVKVFLAVMVGLGVFSGSLAVGLSMYMAVLQRTREIGILKSLGASKVFIVSVIELEAMLLGVAGAVIGILLSVFVAWLINTLIPATLPVIVKPLWWPIAVGIAVAAAALGSLYPGMNAAAQDPIEALAYE
jgi:putative ABC transport system permease protein